MDIVGVIAEYNPLHRGHAWQLQEVRERISSNAGIIVCMSGNFVQRGELAIMPKYRRAESAIKAGANLVIELHPCFATGSANYFAEGAIKSLEACGLEYTLACGAEYADVQVLTALAQIRNAKPREYQISLKSSLARGLSLAAAEEEAMKSYLSSVAAKGFATECLESGETECLEPREAERLEPREAESLLELCRDKSLLQSSNNQLALAYLQAILSIKAENRPKLFFHERLGSTYLEEHLINDIYNFTEGENFSSATAIRKSYYEHEESLEKLIENLRGTMPAQSLASLLVQRQENFKARTGIYSLKENAREKMANALLLMLRAADEEYLSSFAYWNKDLANRVLNCLELRTRVSCNTAQAYMENLVDRVRSKNFTKARIKRALLALLLGIKNNEASNLLMEGAPSYIRVLAADKKGKYILKLLRKTASLPLITKTSDLLEIKSKNATTRRLVDIDLKAEDIFSLLMGRGCGEHFSEHMLLY